MNVAKGQVLRDWRPQLELMLEDDSRHPEWRLVHTVRPGTPEEVLVFKLVKA